MTTNTEPSSRERRLARAAWIALLLRTRGFAAQDIYEFLAEREPELDLPPPQE